MTSAINPFALLPPCYDSLEPLPSGGDVIRTSTTSVDKSQLPPSYIDALGLQTPPPEYQSPTTSGFIGNSRVDESPPSQPQQLQQQGDDAGSGTSADRSTSAGGGDNDNNSMTGTDRTITELTSSRETAPEGCDNNNADDADWVLQVLSADDDDDDRCSSRISESIT